MILNRLQFLALWFAGLAGVVAIAIQTPTVAPANAAASGLTSPGPVAAGVQTGADSEAVATILAVLAPEAAEAGPDALTGDLSLDSLPEGDFSRPVVAAIVEERGVFSVYLRDTESVSALRVGDTWREWRVSEIRPDGVFFESEDLPFDFRVFVNVEETVQ